MSMTTQCNDHKLDAAPVSVPGVYCCVGLSRAEEHQLAARITDGDHEARNRMVQANLGLLGKIALAFRGRGLLLDDLIGEGNLSLIRAAQDFDLRFGTRFSTYAAYWIKEAIRRALIKTTATIRLPAHMVKLLTKWRRAGRQLHHQWGRRPTFEEVATILGLSEGQKSLVARAQPARQLALESNATGGSGSWLSEEATDRHGPIEKWLETDDEWAVTFRRIERLDDRERAVLTLRYGLEDEILTYQQLGFRLGMTREWVRQIELRALCRLGEERSDQTSNSPVGNRSQVRSRGGSAVPA